MARSGLETIIGLATVAIVGIMVAASVSAGRPRSARPAAASQPTPTAAPAVVPTTPEPATTAPDPTKPSAPGEGMPLCQECHFKREPLIPPTALFKGGHDACVKCHLGPHRTIPHPVFMRENCAACHGAAGLPGLRSPHLNWKNCLNCHMSSAAPRPTQPPPEEKR